jgi:hypothetical protein
MEAARDGLDKSPKEGRKEKEGWEWEKRRLRSTGLLISAKIQRSLSKWMEKVGADDLEGQEDATGTQRRVRRHRL